MVRSAVSYRNIVQTFVKVGSMSFGGWSTTALSLEKELVAPKMLSADQLKAAVTYAQILPGATQVAIVSNVGYRLRGARGACLATASYLFPAIGLMVLFALLYFRYLHSPQFTSHLGGLVAALSGVILANAYRIGSKHAGRKILWLFVGIAFVAKLVLGINAVIIILIFGAAGLLASLMGNRNTQ